MTSPSYERVEISRADELDDKIKLLRPGTRPIVFDLATVKTRAEAEEICDQLTQFIKEEAVSPLYPNPIYLVSQFELTDHPFQLFSSYERLPSLYKKPDQLASHPAEKKLQQKIELLTTKIMSSTNEERIKELSHMGKELGELNKIGKICSFYEIVMLRLRQGKRF